MKRFWLVSLAVFALGVSLVSAGFFSSTGMVVDGTSYNNSNLCKDSDGGVYAFLGGVVSWDGVWSKSYKVDTCSGDGKSVKEYYCQTNGKYTSSKVSCSAGCEAMSVEFDGQTFEVGRCIPPEKSCEVVSGGVRDESGKKYKNACDETKSKYTSYSCDENAVVEKVEDCSLLGEFGKCTSNGCAGDCEDTDVSDDINVAGKVVSGGVEYLDTCNSKNTAVKQYKCSKGKVKTVPYAEDNPFKPCGNDRVCVLDSSGAGYCKDKYAGLETAESLNERVIALEALVKSLAERVEALEGSNSIGQ
jgi:hypothetical protein